MRRHELQQARDQLAQLDKAKSRFTANVHHELRTPLTLMLAPMEGMLSGDFGDVDEMQISYLRTMHVNGLRLLKLINNLLDLAKVESGQLQVRRARCQVGRVAQDVVDGARGLAEQKRVQFESLGLEELPVVHADRDALEKVVVNLVGNALKFTDSGGWVEVRGWATEDGGVHLVVADSGVGLGPDELERVFDRFAQADTSATRRHEGTGIGLSLAKELVEGHGGRIWAESQGLGHGAEMHFTLPVGEADGEEEEEVLRTESGEAVALGRSLGAVEAELSADSDDGSRLLEMERSVERWKHQQGGAEASGAAAPQDDRPEILVVEDNADMRRLLHFVVGREFRVRVARNGREGLEALREQAPDLVLTDVMMPEMSGTELCRAIKQDPETAGIPVILVTSKAEREMKIEGLEGGADDYVTKPFHPRELLARVRSFVRLRQLQRELESRNDSLESMNVELARAMDELKQAEVQIVQADRLAAVGELAAGVAHEVNNPVNFALNAVRALGDGVAEVSRTAQALSELDVSEPEKLARQLAQLRDRNGELVPAETSAELQELVEIISEGLTRTERLVSNLRDLAGHGRGDRTGVDTMATRCTILFSGRHRSTPEMKVSP
jgi:signal transduction histidine kinase